MRKSLMALLALFSVIIPLSSAQAAEKTMEERIKALEDIFGGWTVYGSVRFATFYEKSDSSFVQDNDAVTRIDPSPSSALITRPDQEQTQWALANNSRFGLSVDKRDTIGGRVEIGLRNDRTVDLRLGYGTFTYEDITLLFGQDYSPLSDWDYSNQVFYRDNNLGGWGIIEVDGKRIPQVKVKWKGLQIALVENKNATALNLDAEDAHTEVVFPHIEAKYRLDLDTVFADVFGGASTYKVKSESLGVDKNVSSYALGVGGGVKTDPFFAKAMVWTARNSTQMSLHQANTEGAKFNTTDYSLNDDRDMGWALIAGGKIERVTFEAGYGYVYSDNGISGTQKGKARNYYANAGFLMFQNAPKTASFTIVPEVGVFDYIEDSRGNDHGKITYAGAKWQVSF